MNFSKITIKNILILAVIFCSIIFLANEILADCLGILENCTLDSECCSNFCDGSGVCFCRGAGEACTDGLNCCSGECLGDNTCADFCFSGGADCLSDSDCCSDQCTSNTCEDCSGSLDYCTSDSDCCSGICSGNLCNTLLGGNSCSRDQACSTGQCVGGFCTYWGGALAPHEACLDCLGVDCFVSQMRKICDNGSTITLNYNDGCGSCKILDYEIVASSQSSVCCADDSTNCLIRTCYESEGTCDVCGEIFGIPTKCVKQWGEEGPYPVVENCSNNIDDDGDGDIDCQDSDCPADVSCNVCQKDYCNPSNYDWQCIADNTKDGNPCDDGLWCYSNDACLAGSCLGSTWTCAGDPVCIACAGACKNCTCDEDAQACVCETITACSGASSDSCCPAGCDNVSDIDCGGAVCGNGIREAGEQCDDGNTSNGDGCSSTCQNEAPVPSSIGFISIQTSTGPIKLNVIAVGNAEAEDVVRVMMPGGVIGAADLVDPIGANSPVRIMTQNGIKAWEAIP